MWHSLRIGAAIVAVVGLVMSGLAVARAGDDLGSDRERSGAEQIVLDTLAPLLEDGALTQEQFDTVAGELGPIIARAGFRNRTGELVKNLNRLGVEIAEVLGTTPDYLGGQLAGGVTLAEIAESHDVSGEQLVGRVTAHLAAHLAVQVTAGKLDPERANNIVATTAQRLDDLIDVEHPFGTVLKERRNRAIRLAGREAAADALGLSIDEVRAQLEEGNSLAHLAEIRGMTDDDLIGAILTPVIKLIEGAVERGRLVEEEAAEALEKAAARAAEAIHRLPGA